MALETYPPLGQNVNVTLVNGSTAIAYWDGLQWWVGVDGQPDDLPIVNEFVSSWAFQE